MAFGFLTRTLISGIFVTGGTGAVKEPGPRSAVVQKFMKKFDIELDETEAATLVKLNGAAMVAGGTLLSLGWFPRLAAVGLIASLVPTTVAGHPFWEDDEEPKRTMNKVQFYKNLAIIGGLVGILAGARKG